MSPDVTPENLRKSAEQLRDADWLLDASGLGLIGFDLDYLADCFEREANRLEGKPEVD